MTQVDRAPRWSKRKGSQLFSIMFPLYTLGPITPRFRHFASTGSYIVSCTPSWSISNGRWKETRIWGSGRHRRSASTESPTGLKRTRWATSSPDHRCETRKPPPRPAVHGLLQTLARYHWSNASRNCQSAQIGSLRTLQPWSHSRVRLWFCEDGGIEGGDAGCASQEHTHVSRVYVRVGQRFLLLSVIHPGTWSSQLHRDSTCSNLQQMLRHHDCNNGGVSHTAWDYNVISVQQTHRWRKLDGRKRRHLSQRGLYIRHLNYAPKKMCNTRGILPASSTAGRS